MVRKVLFVMPGLNGGGAERVVCQLAGYFAENFGWQVKIILTEDNTCVYPLSPLVEKEYIGKHMPKPLEQIKYIHKNIVQWAGCDVISFLDNQNIFTSIALTGMKNRLIVSERNDPSKVVASRRFLKELLYYRAERIVFQTNEAKAFYPHYLQNKGIVIPNPIKGDLPEPYSGVRRKAFVAYSRLTSQKNIPMMLRAFQIFSQQCPGYLLEIYGKGFIEESLRQMAEELQIGNFVRFMGFCTDVHERIRDATAYLSSSDYEGISNSMLEAMGLGLPVICTDCPIGGAKMMIKNGENGCLVPVNDHQAMADAMLKLVNNPKFAEKLAVNSAKIRQTLSLDIIADEWIRVVENDANS